MTSKLAEIRRAFEAGTKGPWIFCESPQLNCPWYIKVDPFPHTPIRWICEGSEFSRTQVDDGELIALLRNNAEALLDVVEAADAWDQEMQKWAENGPMGRAREAYRAARARLEETL